MSCEQHALLIEWVLQLFCCLSAFDVHFFFFGFLFQLVFYTSFSRSLCALHACVGLLFLLTVK